MGVAGKAGLQRQQQTNRAHADADRRRVRAAAGTPEATDAEAGGADQIRSSATLARLRLD